MVRARAPVAMMTFLACTVRSPPAFSLITALGAGEPFSSRASPSITSILFFFIRKPTPEFSVAATLRERWTTLSKSYAGFSAERP